MINETAQTPGSLMEVNVYTRENNGITRSEYLHLVNDLETKFSGPMTPCRLQKVEFWIRRWYTLFCEDGYCMILQDFDLPMRPDHVWPDSPRYSSEENIYGGQNWSICKRCGGMGCPEI